jgi:hypothetical protein
MLRHLIVTIMIFALSCKKETSSRIQLHNKSPEEIKKYIGGKWKFEYGMEGFSGRKVVYPPGAFIEFSFKEEDSAYLYRADTLFGRSPIQWNVIDNFFDTGTITVISTDFHPHLAADAFFQDTLTLFVPAPDGNLYYLTKAR